MVNVELNITLECNLRCAHCNRMCNLFPDRTEHMSPSQIEKFVRQAESIGGVKRVKIIGGEPTLNPNFEEIYEILAKAGEKGILKYLVVETNGVSKVPELNIRPFSKMQSTPPKKKRHFPFSWYPKDHPEYKSYKRVMPCPKVARCGFSLDKYGYLPCSTSIMIVRLFGLWGLYKKELPGKNHYVWAAGQLCQHCICGLGSRIDEPNGEIFCGRYGKDVSQFTKEEAMPSKTMQEKLDEWNNGKYKEFIEKVGEF